MFLSREDLVNRLHTGDLTIDPYAAEQTKPASIPLRLGHQIATLTSNRTSPTDVNPVYETTGAGYLMTELDVGEALRIEPHQGILACTLEFIGIPADLIGLAHMRPSLSMVGLLALDAVLIDPGFRGRLTQYLLNVSDVPINLFCGQSFLDLSLASLSKPISQDLEYNSAEPSLEQQISDAKKAVIGLEPPQLNTDIDTEDLYKTVLEHKVKDGKALEQLVAALFSRIDGLRVIRTRARLAAEELDIVVENRLTHGFWRYAGNPILVECKDTSQRVSASQVSSLASRLTAMSPDTKTGIIVCRNGVSGNRRSDGVLRIRELRQTGCYVVVLSLDDIERCVHGESISSVIDLRSSDLWLI